MHTWIATREAGAQAYRLHHVLSWRRPSLMLQSTTTPDRAWYGNTPELLADYHGEQAAAPGGRGVTASLGGVLGLTLGRDEGIELTVLGLSLGVDFRRPALKLPGIGRLGMAPVIKGEGDS